MKTVELTNKATNHYPHQEHLEWEDETEACDEDLNSMCKCVVTLSTGVILSLGISLYFLLV